MKLVIAALCLPISIAVFAGPNSAIENFSSGMEEKLCESRFVRQQGAVDLSEQPREAPGQSDFERGLEYQLGTKGRPKDLEAARAAFRESADSGNLSGTFALAALLHRDSRSPKSQAEAIRLFRKLTELNHPGGTAMLALAYKRGNGVGTADYNEYLRLIDKAARLGSVSAQIELLQRLDAKTRHSEDQKKDIFCLNWKLISGGGKQEVALGKAYENGYGVTRDLTRAKYWYCKAAHAGNEAGRRLCGRE